MVSNYNSSSLITEAFPQIKHLSASSINKWSGDYSSQALWFISYILGQKFKGDPKTIRGQVVEDAFHKILIGKDKNVDVFLDRAFRERCSELDDYDKKVYDKELASLPGFLEQSYDAISEYNLYVPESVVNLTQAKITTRLSDNIPFETIGYIDFDLGVYTLDLKSTHKVPSSDIASNHKRQISLYAKTRGDTTAKVLYLSSKKHNLLGIHDREIDVAYDELIYKAESICKRLEAAAILSNVKGTKPEEELSHLITADPSSWAWKEEDRYIAAQNELWGLKLN